MQEGAQVAAMAPAGKHTQGFVQVGEKTLYFDEDKNGKRVKIESDEPAAIQASKVDPLAKLNKTYDLELALDKDGRETLLNELQNNKQLTGMFTSVTQEEVEAHAGAIRWPPPARRLCSPTTS